MASNDRIPHNASDTSWSKDRRKAKPGKKFSKDDGKPLKADKKFPPEVAGTKHSDSGAPSNKTGRKKSKDIYKMMVDAVENGPTFRNLKKPKDNAPSDTGTYSPKEYEKWKEKS